MGITNKIRLGVLPFNEEQRLTRKMTNWQNSQWLRGGCNRNIETIQSFLILKHGKENKISV